MIAVLDASVAIKWFRQEADTDAAMVISHAIANDAILVRVPNLIRYEVTNVLVWKGKTGSEDARAALDVLDQLPWHVVNPTHDLLTAAITIADRYRTSVYDAVYVALALESHATLVTADEKLIAKLDHPNIVHLRNFTIA